MVETFNSKVLEKKQLTDTVICITLDAPKYFTFIPGQFVQLTITNPESGNDKNYAYSILNNPKEKGRIDLCIKLIPDGIASRVFKNMHLGDIFSVRGPFGRMRFNERAHEHYFLCTGTGIAPLYSIITEYIDRSDHSFKLFFGAKTKDDLLFYDEFSALAETHDTCE